MEFVIIALIVIIVLALFFVIGQYNSLVKLRNSLQESWRQIDVELNRRYDLIPNLVETVKGYANFERGTLENVIAMRNQAMQYRGGASQQRSDAEGMLTQAVTSFIATAEAYPELKANANFQQLSAELSSTEDRIANSRRYYNAIVGDYNTKTETFPSVIIANMFKFEKAGYFEVNDPAMRAAQKVDFSDLNTPSLANPAVNFGNTAPAVGTGQLQTPVQPPVPAPVQQVPVEMPAPVQPPAQPPFPTQ